MTQIAEAKGITREQLSQALLDAMRQNMQHAVEQGWLTQTQVDTMLQHMEQFGIENMLDHMGSGGMMGGSGGCHGGTTGATIGPAGRGPGGMMGGFGGSMMGGWSRY